MIAKREEKKEEKEKKEGKEEEEKEMEKEVGGRSVMGIAREARRQGLDEETREI